MLSVKWKPYGNKAKTLSTYSDEQNIVIDHDKSMFTLVEYTSFIYINYFGMIMYKFQRNKFLNEIKITMPAVIYLLI